MYRKNKSKHDNNEGSKESKDSSCALSLGEYNKYFVPLSVGEKKNFKDSKSDQNSYIPIEICEDAVYIVEPDGNLIPNIQKQQKCDFLVYCKHSLQTCFIELKGANISIKKSYNPYDQIIGTVKYLKSNDILRKIVSDDIEKHAFIVSPKQQKLPKGVETKERALWQQLVQNTTNKRGIAELIHYVKVTKTDRYSNNQQIICSSRHPIELPFKD